MHGDVEVLHRPGDQAVHPAEHARRRAAELQVELPDRVAVKHGVKCHRLEDMHRRDLADLGDLVHRRHWYVAALLLLREVEERNRGGNALAARELGQDFMVDPLVARGGEVPGDARIVGVGVMVAHLAVNAAAGETQSRQRSGRGARRARSGAAEATGRRRRRGKALKMQHSEVGWELRVAVAGDGDSA